MTTLLKITNDKTPQYLCFNTAVTALDMEAIHNEWADIKKHHPTAFFQECIEMLLEKLPKYGLEGQYFFTVKEVKL